MKKTNLARRVLSAMLGILMLTSLLTSCGSVGNQTNIDAAKAMTVTITMIKEEGMTDAGIQRVQDAINELTENRYNTHVVLQMFTADEYAQKVLEMSQKLDINNASQDDSTYVSSEVILDDNLVYKQSENGDYYLVDEQNRSHVVYPTLIDTQLDVLFINDIATYSRLAKGDGVDPYITSLTPLMGASDLPVSKYVNSTLLSHARKVNGQFLAIPNNTYFGEYSYMFINKKYFDACNYDISLVKSFADVEAFVYDMANNEAYKNVTPVYNFNGFNFLSYFDFASPLLLQQSTGYGLDTPSHLNDMTRMSFYQASMNMLYNLSKLTDRTYIETNEVDFTKDFAVAFMDGTSSIPTEYADPDKDGNDDYYVINCSRPAVDNTMFDSMFAISEFSPNKERAFQILALLQADAEVVNLLAYGLPNIDYELDKDGVVVYKENSGYAMNYRNVGNNFLCYPNEKMDEETMKFAADDWKVAKAHNEKLVISPYCGFYIEECTFSDYVYYDDTDSGIVFKELPDKTGVQLVDTKGNLVKEKGLTKIYLYNSVMMKDFEEYCKTFVPRMSDFEAADEYESYKAYLKALSAELQSTEVFSQITGTNTMQNNTYSNSCSPAAQFTTFWNRTYKLS